MNSYRNSLVLVIVISLLTFFGSSLLAAIQPGDSIGQPFMGIQAQSRGEGVSSVAALQQYQCVDLARDFAIAHQGGNFPQVGCAANMWNVLPSAGYIAIPNDGNQLPRVGDFIIWWQDGFNNSSDCNLLPGHVSIVCRVEIGRIQVFEQNIWVDNPCRDLPVTFSASGDYVVGNGPGLSSGYHIEGWLRHPAFPSRYYTVGYNANGNMTTEILNAYVDHGDQTVFGLPVARNIDGAIRPSTVWDWEVCSTQVFDGGQLGECAIIYDQWTHIGEAFPVHGQLWAYYKAYGGPYMLLNNTRLGGPLGSEQYATDNSTGNLLVVQEFANGYLVYDTVIGTTDRRPLLAGGGDPDFTIIDDGSGDPDPSVPTQMAIQVPQTTLVFPNTMTITATVYDDTGTAMLNQRVLFVGSNSQIAAVDADRGEVLPNSAGTIQVWAELYDDRSIQSDRVSVIIVVPPQETIDLSSSLQLITAQPIAGEPVTVRIITVNSGTDQSDGSIIRITDDVSGQFWQYFTGFVPANGTWAVNVGIGPFTAGTHRLTIETDTANQIAETNESNNTSFLDIQVSEQPAPPPPEVVEISVNYSIHGTDLELPLPSLSGATQAIIYLDDSNSSANYSALPGSTYWVYGLDPDLYHMRIDLYTSDPILIGRSPVYEFTIDQSIPEPPSPQPDLTVDSVSVNPTELTSNDSVELSIVIDNVGGADADNSELAIVSSDQAVDPLYVDVSSLAAGQSANLNVELPAHSSGTHFITAMADFSGVIDESDEGNNSYEVEISVAQPPAYPDLVVEVGIGDYPEVYINEPIYSGGSITNIGDADAGPVELRITCGDFEWAEQWSGLAAGQTRGYDFDLLVSTPGDQVLTAVIDPNNTIVESNETNNSFSLPLTFLEPVPIPDLPDLAISNVWLSTGSPSVNRSFYLYATITNQGTVTTPRFEFIGCEAISPGLTIIGVPVIRSLAPGRSTTVHWSVRAFTAGNFQIDLEVDPDNQLEEQDEANNTASLSVTVSAGRLRYFWPLVL